MKKTERGFTLLELMIVVGVIVLLSALTYISFSNLNKKEVLDKGALQVLSLFQEARSSTLSSKGASQYGIYLESDKLTLFKGVSYSAGDPNNKVTDLHPQVTISVINLSRGGSTVVFDRLTGATLNYGTTTISLRSDPTQTKVVVVYQTGVSEVQ